MAHPTMNWETEQIVDWISNDEYLYNGRGEEDNHAVESYLLQVNPNGFDGFEWGLVDWDGVWRWHREATEEG